MKKMIRFSKFFNGAIILSSVLIIAGIVSLCTRSMNWGLEFKPGQNIQVEILNADTHADAVVAILSDGGVKAEVKSVGDDNTEFQIRTSVDGNVESSVLNALGSSFGAENVTVIQSQLISAQFSGSLIRNSIILVVATLVLIFAYIMIRFKWDLALGSIVALIHDALIMISFLSWSGLEFTTTSIAAILTIIGYSINATVVILDRVRGSMKTAEADNFRDILDISLTGALSRSIITTLTTLFAVVALAVYTKGDIQNFAIALIVGLISGCYSSIFISSAVISKFRKNWKPAAFIPKPLKMEEQV